MQVTDNSQICTEYSLGLGLGLGLGLDRFKQ